MAVKLVGIKAKGEVHDTRSEFKKHVVQICKRS